MTTAREPAGGHLAGTWYTCVRAARPFREVRTLPPELRLPRWFPVFLAVLIAAGVVMAFTMPAASLPARAAAATFYSSAYVYFFCALLDGAEHFRLEKHVTGRYLSWTVVPFDESVVHVAILGTLLAVLMLARPVASGVELRDWFVLGAPVLFLVLSWTDELVYHRRRALHREDILHTISHLAAGTMLVALFASKVIDWHRIA